MNGRPQRAHVPYRFGQCLKVLCIPRSFNSKSDCRAVVRRLVGGVGDLDDTAVWLLMRSSCRSRWERFVVLFFFFLSMYHDFPVPGRAGSVTRVTERTSKGGRWQSQRWSMVGAREAVRVEVRWKGNRPQISFVLPASALSASSSCGLRIAEVNADVPFAYHVLGGGG